MFTIDGTMTLVVNAALILIIVLLGHVAFNRKVNGFYIAGILLVGCLFIVTFAVGFMTMVNGFSDPKEFMDLHPMITFMYMLISPIIYMVISALTKGMSLAINAFMRKAWNFIAIRK